MNSQTEQLEQKNQKLKMAENTQRIVTDGVILIAGVLMAAVCGHFAEQGTVSADQAMVAVIAMISSFGPTAALSALSNNLQHITCEWKPCVGHFRGRATGGRCFGRKYSV